MPWMYCRNLLDDLLELCNAFDSDNAFDFERTKPLLNIAIAPNPDDSLMWDQVYKVISETTPPRTIASSLQQTPWPLNTSKFEDSSQHRKYADDMLKQELGIIYAGLRDFDQTYFGDVADLKTTSEAFFQQCIKGSDPLFDNGWTGWPIDANEDDVLNWLADFSERLSTFAEERKSTPPIRRRPLAKHNQPIDTSVALRKMDIGFMFCRQGFGSIA
ncbi:hypothetical protein VP1G_04970 [Cytospora mali]|uniref:Uncharacterized protein n=1 Tax=Cytospora mali TaxID=578113 RepID=A0A194V133_CYTMA|nr:hypothetical protein VP1G_04970 [Valsa mali var. pyri (nom. inval.)]